MGIAIPTTESTRRSVTIPAQLAARIDTIADHRHVTSNRVILDLIEDGIAAYDRRRAAFLELTEQFQKSTDPVETERLREELLRMTFVRSGRPAGRLMPEIDILRGLKAGDSTAAHAQAHTA
jgi:hypothetical protein